MISAADSALLGPAEIRRLAAQLELRPTKQWGQNFVIDANTVRKIVRVAGVGPDDVVVEVGPGLGSLTLALLPAVKHVTAIEVDPRLAATLEDTVARLQPEHADRLRLVAADALTVTRLPKPTPTALVANLPYNVSVPVVLSFLERFPSIERVLVMVQLEVAERLAATPGSRVYGVPSLKAAWYADVELAGRVARTVFWPAPNVDSGLVSLVRRDPPSTTASREEVFRCIDAAFRQRRKSLRKALASWAGSAEAAEAALVAAGVDPRTRGEQLDIAAFARIAEAHTEAHTPAHTQAHAPAQDQAQDQANAEARGQSGATQAGAAAPGQVGGPADPPKVTA
ncbi:MAG: 16S rRNA (adenine(1518)-N(6)/adenine(1519)-N(6))-dimethyltransferase RsmA [Intrasporangium sp.]|uniref:16S rRNA (adenine(1518)-N(6)/adenine(1519)-N(6))- dimethyltransferase RsmA n=1 Tax=Intrasporangium sp. TaxID=1925024 RepID=UPI00264894BB|nr:16S rRNA (adenine(1518)-N(6)/adenine(1519)-N(6))-dimethyltransferase RsmA [Intrasporangium sp.]MDN5797613.1 16S rRNA (adenine(1518)-N(6)/adenine(1519)-N(6))-dimethyltransferase RsmA [Intrasporangium sp.]